MPPDRVTRLLIVEMRALNDQDPHGPAAERIEAIDPVTALSEARRMRENLEFQIPGQPPRHELYIESDSCWIYRDTRDGSFLAVSILTHHV